MPGLQDQQMRVWVVARQEEVTSPAFVSGT